MSIANNQNQNANQPQLAAVPASAPQAPAVQVSVPVAPKVQLQANPAPAVDVALFEKLPLTQQLLQLSLISKQQALGIKSQVEDSGQLESDVILSGLFIDPDKTLQIKSIVFRIPYVDLAGISIPVATLQKLRSDVAQRYQAIIFDDQGDYVKVAMVDPLDVQATNFISTMLGKRVEAHFADPAAISKIIQTKYGAQVGSDVSRALEDVKSEVVDVSGNIDEVKALQGDISTAPVARIVNVILEYAVRMKASDIHIEPRENKLIVRNRIHGVLSEKLVLPSKLAPSVVSRIKILSNLKIDEHRIPQDGRFQIKVDKDYIDLRVSIIPASYGEKVVMRLLEKAGGAVTLDQTGLRGRNYDEFYKAIRKTMGIVLVTGPTGSGKTVTLASCLKILNTEGVNILTLEDPVEIRIDGVNQVQVNPDVGLTFAKGLRAFLRQDPNIIMIGEIRDGETADLAVQAALTGHLVLSTLHTNDAPSTISRLMNMGIEPFLVATSVHLICAQRLIRRVCKDCKEEVATPPQALVDAGFSPAEAKKLVTVRGKGCQTCNGTGYKGRVGLYEVMEINDDLRELILIGASGMELKKKAIENGMITLRASGLQKLRDGVTTMEEVLRETVK